jgi:preprotein translocase subunit SecD
VRRSHIVSLLIVTIFSIGSFITVLALNWGPILGVQLQGGVEVVLRPVETADDETLDQAIEIIRSRIDAFGVAEPDITRQGQQVVIQLPGVEDQNRAVELVGQTAELQFRPVLNITGSNPSIYVAADPEQRAQAKGLLDVLNGISTEAEPLPTTTASPTTAPADAGVTTSVAPTTAPVTSVAPTTTIFDASSAPELSEIITIADSADTEDFVLFTNLDQSLIYLLGPAEVTGDAVSSAAATFQNQWVVNVNFNAVGADQFDVMAAANLNGLVAIALDGVVYSAPQINSANFGGTAVISGAFEEQDSKDLALVLRFGALPVEFIQDDVRTVSATLGEGTLRAGIIAGLIGLLLVGAYMVAYYRMLGIVAILSLVVSGAILWAIISFLGETQGLALTLAGATGIIVSVGVAVDSNIVYYERIKEEVRRGRAIRSAADNSFHDAFMTIIWADMASLIGAFVLYYLTSGSVKGFALFLGLATMIDIFVSYFFMRPLVVLVTRKLVDERPSRIGAPIHAGSAATTDGEAN